MAILRQSNLFDADRHLLFIYAPLCIVALQGLQHIQSSLLRPLPRVLFAASIALLMAVMIIDDISLHPYQLAYLNEPSRLIHNHTTTSLDYWSVSAKEALLQAQRNDALPMNHTVADTQGAVSLFIAHRQLAGHVEAAADQRLVLQVRNPSAFRFLSGCVQASQVERKLVFGHRMVMSRLLVCPAR